jgi:hypothetical protein
VALFSITIAASLFAMPVVYHHLQYPYKNLEKFKVRSHRFIILGLIHSGITLYLGIEIALGSVLNTSMSFVLAAIPFIIVYGTNPKTAVPNYMLPYVTYLLR